MNSAEGALALMLFHFNFYLLINSISSTKQSSLYHNTRKYIIHHSLFQFLLNSMHMSSNIELLHSDPFSPLAVIVADSIYHKHVTE